MNMNDLFMELYREKYGDKINRELAEHIVEGFPIPDGSDRANGEKWTFDEAKAAGDKMGINWENVSKCEWYIVLNNMYSDHYPTGKRHGMSNDFYYELAADWFADEDGDKDKTFRYFIHL